MEPGLTFPQIDPFVFEIGGFGLRWYALAYIAGLVLGWRYIMLLTARPRLWPGQATPFQPAQTENLLFITTLCVILGGRLGFVLFYDPAYYLANPLDILKTWQGGMSFHGGFLGVVIGAWIFCRSNPAPLLSTGDAMACVAPFGILFGRLANFINGELWGKPWVGGAWSMVFPADPTALPRHPSQLYEAASEGLVLTLVLMALAWGGGLRRPGLCMGVFIAGYGTARAVVEHWREANTGLECVVAPFGYCMQMGQVLSLPMVGVGLALIAYALTRPAPGPA